MHTFFQDIRYGLRGLVKAPGFTLIAVLSMALGIAANTSIFSMVYSVLLRPLPFAEPSRLVAIERGGLIIKTFTESATDFLESEYQTTSFESLAAYDNEGSVNLTENGDPERILTSRVSTNFFSTLGVGPALGRNFVAAEGKVGGDRVVILSHSLWQRRFNSDRAVIGKAVKLNSQSFAVIGVMPAGFEFPQYNGRAEMWVPLIWNDSLMSKEGIFIEVLGRLKPGVSLESSQAEMNSITGRVQQEAKYKVDPIKIVLLSKYFSRDLGPALWMLLGAVGFVLLIGCANVASLLLARGASRQKEMALRAAVGAARKRLVRQMLTESMLLALLSGGVGIFLSWLSLNALVLISPVQLPQIHAIDIDRPVLLFTLAASVLTGFVFGLAPALQFSKPDLNDLLRAGASRRGAVKSSLRHALIIIEVAIALVLVVGAALMLKSFRNLMSLEKGFDPSGVLTLEIAPPELKYKDKKQQAGFYQEIIENVRVVPGVLSVGGANHIPMASKQGRMILPLYVEGREVVGEWKQGSGDYRIASPDYFRAMGMTLLKGRTFSDQDNQSAPRVVIVNEAVARMLFPGEDPIGKRLLIASAKAEPSEIIGVVANIKNWGLTQPGAPEFYLSYQQTPPRFLELAVRTKGDPRSLIGQIKRAVQTVDPDQPLYNVVTMEQALSESISEQRFAMLMLGIFAAVAFGMALIGIYGVMSHSVSQRIHEIGVRMALGAARRDVVWMILRRGLTLTAIGITLGLGCSLMLTRLLKSLLFEVRPTDPAVFAGAAILFVTVALLACFIPVRRATRVDPMVALRYE